MQTNFNPQQVDELKKKGDALLEAAYAYWQLHRQICGLNAVVWLEADNGHFVLFTRSEYKHGILRGAGIETAGEDPIIFDSPKSPLDSPAKPL